MKMKIRIAKECNRPHDVWYDLEVECNQFFTTKEYEEIVDHMNAIAKILDPKMMKEVKGETSKKA